MWGFDYKFTNYNFRKKNETLICLFLTLIIPAPFDLFQTPWKRLQVRQALRMMHRGSHTIGQASQIVSTTRQPGNQPERKPTLNLTRYAECGRGRPLIRGTDEAGARLEPPTRCSEGSTEHCPHATMPHAAGALLPSGPKVQIGVAEPPFSLLGSGVPGDSGRPQHNVRAEVGVYEVSQVPNLAAGRPARRFGGRQGWQARPPAFRPRLGRPPQVLEACWGGGGSDERCPQTQAGRLRAHRLAETGSRTRHKAVLASGPLPI